MLEAQQSLNVERKLIQPIIVSSKGSHEGTILSAVNACDKIFSQSYLGVQQPGAVWTQWLANSFTKSVRRANPRLMEKITGYYKGWFASSSNSPFFNDYYNHALAFTPVYYPFDKTDSWFKLLAKTQVSSTDFIRLNWPQPPTTGFVLAINPNIKMTTGKTAAQCCHAMLAWKLRLQSLALSRFELIRITDNPAVFEELKNRSDVVPIHDAGRTEVPPGTLTVVAGYI